MRRELDSGLDNWADVADDLREGLEPTPPVYSPREPHRLNRLEWVTLIGATIALSSGFAGFFLKRPEVMIGGFVVGAALATVLIGSVVARDGLDRVMDRAERFYTGRSMLD